MEFHPGCYFKARMPLFILLTKFVRAALGRGYGRLRGSPSHPQLCFNGLSHHRLMGSLQVAMRESCMSQHVFLYHSVHIWASFLLCLALQLFPRALLCISCSLSLSPEARCRSPLTLVKLLPHEVLLNCGNSVAERTAVRLSREHVSALAGSTWRRWK